MVDLDLWSLDRPLTYAVPEKLADRIALGSIVRVPLRQRRVRGWVVGIGTADTSELKPVAAVSGRGPVFDDAGLAAARALSQRYIHPLSQMLSLMTPLRLGRAGVPFDRSVAAPHAGGESWVSVLQIPPSVSTVGRYAQMIDDARSKGWSAVVVVPEVREGSQIVSELSRRFDGQSAIVHSAVDPADRSKALWDLASGKRAVALGGRAAVWAPLSGPMLVIVHAEHDRSLKEQRSPYYDARRVAIERVRTAGGQVVLASKTPSVATVGEAQGSGWTMAPARREDVRNVWPVVEIVEPPRTGIPRRAIAAIIEARRAEGRSLILLPRTRSTKAGPGPEQVVRMVGRIVPGASISRADRPSLGQDPGALARALEADVVVGTFAALADVERPDFASCIVLGVDSFMQMPSGRAVEDAFASIFEAATWVAPKGRLILETREPEHRLVQGVVRGDPMWFARQELAERRAAGSPPFATLVRVTLTAGEDEGLSASLSAIPGCMAMGPVPAEHGAEFMLFMGQRKPGLDALGTIVRQSPARVLVEVDPRDW